MRVIAQSAKEGTSVYNLCSFSKSRRKFRMRCAVIGSFLLLTAAAVGQTNTDPQDIVQKMMPDSAPTDLRMPTEQERPRFIGLLKAAQAQASGERAQQIAFLLAVLGSDYAANRRYLVRALQNCNVKWVQSCDEETAALVAGLFRRGDDTLLVPLLKAGPTSDGALGEFLGDFYADVLTNQTTKFLNGIRPFAPQVQESLCTLAGERDGGGIAQEELQHVRKLLRRIGSESALRCLRAVDAVNKQIDSADKSE